MLLRVEGQEGEEFNALTAARLLPKNVKTREARASAAPSDAEVELLNRVARYFAGKQGRDAGELARQLHRMLY